MLFDQDLEEPDQKKDKVKKVQHNFKNVFTCNYNFQSFFMDPDFKQNRIRTQEKNTDPYPDKRTRIRNTAPWAGEQRPATAHHSGWTPCPPYTDQTQHCSI